MPTNARPGLVRRLVLTEPVRLYLWLAGFVLILAATTLGATTDQAAQYFLGSLATALGMAGAGEAARVSVYSQASHLGEMIASRGSWAIPTPESDRR